MVQKRSKWISIRNIFIIFIVSGFWHGANWTFIIWGLIHAMLYIPLFLRRKNRQYTTSIVAEDKWLPSLNELFQMVSTFFFTMIAWVFFRSESVQDGYLYLLNMVLKFDFPLNQRKGFVYVFVIIILDWIYKKNKNLNNVKNKNLNIVLLIIIGSIIFLFSNPIKQSDFIYFQF